MGKRARTTARKSRGAVSGNGKPDAVIADETGSTGSTASVAGDSDSGSIIDPASIGRNAGSADDNGSPDSGTGETTGERTKRPYKRRAAKTPNADAVSLSIGSFKDLLYSGHAMLHSITQASVFDIDEDDAAKLAQAISNVTRHYDVPQMAQKTVDWIMLMQSVGAVYGPRVMAMRLERSMRNAKPPAQSPHAPQNIVPSPRAPAPQQQRATVPEQNKLPREQPAPSPGDKVAPPAPPPPAPSGPARRQPGLDTLDGAGMPLKFN